MRKKLFLTVTVLLLLAAAFTCGVVLGKYEVFASPHMKVVHQGLKAVWDGSFSSSYDVAAGGKLFRVHCAACHGIDGTGGRGPDLTSGEFRHAVNDSALRRIILRGIEGTEMPGLVLVGGEISHIVAYLNYIRRSPDQRNLKGDGVRGQQLFRDVGGCFQCHRVNGKGGRLGPDLSDIGSLRSPQYLRASIVEPSKEISRGYRTARVVDNDGKTVRGFLLDEDTYSVRILDMEENLLSFWKENLHEISYENVSLMPSSAQVFNEGELDSLVSYLSSLRSPKPRGVVR
jgi:cytochrome c oxidase cbb3-type subunit 3